MADVGHRCILGKTGGFKHLRDGMHRDHEKQGEGDRGEEERDGLLRSE